VISPDPEILTDGPLFKVVLCGDVCVGKSSFMFRACNKSFKKHIRTTLGVDFQTKNVRINPSKTIAVQLWDTAGQERFRSMTSSYFRRAHGVILIYDVTNPESFLNVKEWMETITSTSDAGTPVMICGNKIDLRTKSYGRLNEVVYSKEGAQLAANYGSLFMETSAASGLNVDAALLTLARHLHKRTDCENGLIYDLKVQSETTDDSGCC
uniref:Uncharacterized protein n=1 Tax=Ciona savignyi TaxID=51511 RepID=H2YHB0_CIOSA